MCVIIEGCDRTGKSTLARELSKRLYLPVVNRQKPKESIFIECVDSLTKMEPVIFDRFHISEIVYGPMKRGLVRFDYRQIKIIELLCRTIGTVNIYCTDRPDRIKRRFLDGPTETFITQAHVSECLERFNVAIHESSLDWWHYTIGDDIDELAATIAARIEEHTKSFDVSKHVRYRTIGNLRGTTLFVGERYGGPPFLRPLVPFGNGAPGLRFFEAVREAGLSWKELLITNAVKLNEPEVGVLIDHAQALWDELTLPNVRTVICLGNAAFDAVLSIMQKTAAACGRRPKLWRDPSIRKVMHPSGAFAYRGMTVGAYADLLLEAKV